ncbi:DNA polymerase delta catalytic subunit-like [Parasteatoda tepidariorum]|uniref:DNA polymerase delta catalytic subunit-like n=1 Tax=Parasteatoda tepidariorum TaxID=114398 RepID=UPI0039BC38F6
MSQRKTFGSQGAAKKFKKANDDDEEEFERSKFEDELALMDDLEEEMRAESLESPELIGEDVESISNAKWTRPPPPPIDPKKDSIMFQQLDIAYYIGQPVPGMPGCKVGPVPIMRMFGVSME